VQVRFPLETWISDDLISAFQFRYDVDTVIFDFKNRYVNFIQAQNKKRTLCKTVCFTHAVKCSEAFVANITKMFTIIKKNIIYPICYKYCNMSKNSIFFRRYDTIQILISNTVVRVPPPGPGPPEIPVLEVKNSPPRFCEKNPRNPSFLQLSTITPITLVEAVLLDKRCHFLDI